MSIKLCHLATILYSGIETLLSEYNHQGVAFPLLSQPFTPSPLDTNSVVNESTCLIIAAAHQIIATVRAPAESIQEHATGAYTATALNLCVDVHVADILQGAGAQGIHTRELGTKTNIATKHLYSTARILRYLSTRHIFQEIEPDVFANNRISSLLIKPHSLNEIDANPDIEFEGATLAGFVGHVTDECLKASVSIVPWLKDKSTQFPSPFNMSIGSSISLFEWFEAPENTRRLRRATAAMTGGGERFPATIFTNVTHCLTILGFNWKSLKEDAVVVDVGGSVGSVTYTIFQQNKHLRYVIQDLESIINKEAKQYWEEKMPQALTDGQVTLQVTNFFEFQPVQNAAVYFLRLILHDWPDEKCLAILKILRRAAGPLSKLIVFEQIMAYSCKYSGPFADVSNPIKAPAPLLANLGMGAGGFITMIDMQMLTLFNGKERTVTEFINLGSLTGWELEDVKPGLMNAMVFSAV
ncbi:S-adenosyl-L-methionine-dependent methyltransferase [Lentinula novae-zelandiae]|nr:S-adenosyl-L-methionine-dependent methyltransferase [Lentinula novae-zelandiae]